MITGPEVAGGDGSTLPAGFVPGVDDAPPGVLPLAALAPGALFRFVRPGEDPPTVYEVGGPGGWYYQVTATARRRRYRTSPLVLVVVAG